MEAINPLVTPGAALHTGQAKTETKRGKETGKGKKSIFSGLLRKAETEEEQTGGILGVLNTPGVVSEEVFQESIDQIFNLGEELKRKQTPQAYQEYRKSIQLFFRYVVDNGLETGKQTGLFDYRNLKPAKEYTLIRVIDRKLEDLAVSILKGQKDNLKILEKIDEIQGLLVDLLQE